MGILSRIVDTIRFIRENGWHEYREARRRYDNHARLQQYGDGKFNQRKYIKMVNAAKKRK